MVIELSRMPELPEVECVRRSLERRLVGRRVIDVTVHRHDIVRGCATPQALLCGARVQAVSRHGKQLAILGCVSDKKGATSCEPCLCIHLGMSGSLRYLETPRPKTKPRGPSATTNIGHDRHVHAIWWFDRGQQLEFRDPRRFGGLWPFSDPAGLRRDRWGRLGPDAASITSQVLHRRLARSHRAIKSALLDQSLIAGLGNIYVDELLHVCELHPLVSSDSIDSQTAQLMVRRLRGLLQRAITAGGSTLRDYQNVDGQLGGFQSRHRVYSRSGLPCRACDKALESIRVAGRTTVFCPRCQPSPKNRLGKISPVQPT